MSKAQSDRELLLIFLMPFIWFVPLRGFCGTVRPAPAGFETHETALSGISGPRDILLLPSPASPSVVYRGESFEIVLSTPKNLSDPGVPHDWAVWLSTSAEDAWGKRIGQRVGVSFALKVEQIKTGPGNRTIILSVNAGYKAPRDTYHLKVVGPLGLSVSSIYSVRILGTKQHRSLRVAVLADHQLRDPSVKLGGGDLNNGSYPHHGTTLQESIMLQEESELSFFDPDFVLHLGDFVFGTDYKSEIPDTLHLWWQRPQGTLMVPGNHDGMALYRLYLKRNWYKDALHSLACANKVFSKDVDITGVFSLLQCLYGDLKKMLFENLDQDGLAYWREFLGPENFSLSIDKVRFIGLNSYSGSAQRRHGFALSLDAFGMELNFGTAVDNYGGFVSKTVLEWLQNEISSAKQRGEKVVLFLHHDPRGNEDSTWASAYHPNLPFPTEPLGLRKFQEWNFEGNPDWDSDPDDGISAETQKSNSAVRLLKLVARGVDLVLMGHIHADRDKVYKPGDELVKGSGIRARQVVRFTRVTTASAHPADPDGYWGYRLAEISSKSIRGLSWRPDRGWASVPAGNLWIVGQGVLAGNILPGLSKDLLYIVHNGLPQKVAGILRAYLDASVVGWTFDTSGKGKVSLVNVATGDRGRNIYYLRVSMPACSGEKFPPLVGTESVLRIKARRARGNRVPVADFSISDSWPGVGQDVDFDAGATADPDGDSVISYKWDFGDGYDQRGKRAAHSFRQPGKYEVRMTASDSHGAYSSYTQTIRVSLRPSCSSSERGPRSGLVLGLFVLVLIKRKKIKNR